MSMSDCPKCWNTPCSCGYDYRNYTKEKRIYLASKFIGIDSEKLANILEAIIPDIHPMKDNNE